MMSTRFLPVCFFMPVLIFLSSCNGGGEKSATGQTGSDTTTTTATTESVAPSTIITTPQSMLLVKAKIANFEKWKPGYEAHDSVRLAHGLHNYVIGRGIDDSNMVVVALKADDIAKAKAFAASLNLKETMRKGGVTGKPTFTFLNATFQDTVVLNSALRSMTSFSVKDWDTWQKAFTEGRPERIDNGIADRLYGYDADDNHKVTLVTALVDTAKAHAYWKSDKLKERKAASGALGVPDRFVFRIVQRY